MNNDFQIETEDKEGNKYELVFSQSFSLLNFRDTVTISLPMEYFNWKIKLMFEEDNGVSKYGAKIEYLTDIIEMKLYGWDSPTYVENLKPYHFWNNDKSIEFYAKIRTIANADKNFRVVNFTLYRKK